MGLKKKSLPLVGQNEKAKEDVLKSLFLKNAPCEFSSMNFFYDFLLRFFFVLLTALLIFFFFRDPSPFLNANWGYIANLNGPNFSFFSMNDFDFRTKKICFDCALLCWLLRFFKFFTPLPCVYGV